MGSRGYKQCALFGVIAFTLLDSTFAVLGAEEGSGNMIGTPGTPVNTVGELTVLQACDFEHGRSELIHLLRDFKTDKTVRLRFQRGAPSRLRSGSIVRVRGDQVAEEIVLPANGSGSVETMAEAPLVSGNQSTVVILINFLDASIECSAGMPLARKMSVGSSAIASRS